jgi:hypothetical protein
VHTPVKYLRRQGLGGLAALNEDALPLRKGVLFLESCHSFTLVLALGSGLVGSVCSTCLLRVLLEATALAVAAVVG